MGSYRLPYLLSWAADGLLPVHCAPDERILRRVWCNVDSDCVRAKNVGLCSAAALLLGASCCMPCQRSCLQHVISAHWAGAAPGSGCTMHFSIVSALGGASHRIMRVAAMMLTTAVG